MRWVQDDTFKQDETNNKSVLGIIAAIDDKEDKITELLTSQLKTYSLLTRCSLFNGNLISVIFTLKIRNLSD